MIRRDDDKKILIFDIIKFSAFFPGYYTTYEINSICTMYKLCLLITVNILFNYKAQKIKELLLDVTDDMTFSFKINLKKSFMR